MKQQPFVVLRSTQDANNNNNNNNNNDDGNDDNPSRLRRKRDRIKDWISSGRGRGGGGGGGDKSPMVRPILEDGSFDELPERKRRRISGSRIKANFDDLFAGMPSMQDILGSDEEMIDDDVDNNDINENNSNKRSSNDNNLSGGVKKKRRINKDDSWFLEEKKEIEANYQEICQEMVAKVQEQRRQDPDGVPTNAEAMIQDVLKQEMATEIEATKQARARENLDNLASKRKEEVEARDLRGVSDPAVDKLIEEDQAAKDKADKARARIDDYRRYELEAFLKNQNGDDSYNNENNNNNNMDAAGRSVPIPDANTDLDQWALERLQAMADTRLEDGDDDNFIVTDIIEDSLEDLRDRIEREAGRSTRIQPATLKEWQMYRAIATRLGIQNEAADAELSEDATEEQIAAQLKSWKEYIAKEGKIRKKSGLTRGQKLPFEWQESSRDKAIEEAQIKAALEKQKGMSKVEIRKEVNRKSIEAMEQLLETADSIRSERIRKDIAELKQELEANDYLDIDEAALQEEADDDDLGPVDISDVFSTTSTEDIPVAPMPSWSTTAAPPPPNTPFFSENNDRDSDPSPPQQPPATPFFSQDDDVETVQGPPDTPFFSSSDQDYADEDGDGGSADSEYSLGTIEEQKLRAMYQRAGARTEEEKAAIRAQWEEFQQFEKSRREESGLTDGDDSELMNKADINYDIADVTKEDGDFDAEKILASIGPRPTRRKRKAESMEPKSEETTPVYESSTTPPASDLYPDEISDSLYRAVSAVGGGRTRDDPEAKAEEKAAYSDFLEKENEMRQSLDDLNEEISSERTNVEGEFDDAAYAQDVLSSLGPRPKPKRRKLNAAEYSDNSIALSSESDDDEDDDGEVQQSESSTQRGSESSSPFDRASSEDDVLPGWLRKEREQARSQAESSGGGGGFLGSDIDDVFDDDTYEHNQRQLAEYERRRAGKKKQMGIDISDVLGRSSDDYADYNYDDNYFRAKKSGWGTSGFESRKADFLEYTELNVIELNSLMAHKDSVHATGMSQYLPRINKPFKEFGAIFRLEGVLIDTTGLQYEAWTRVAKEKGFRAPSLEEVRRASVLRSDVAVSEAFFWTNDFILSRETAAAHQQAFADVFNEWMKEQSIDSSIKKQESTQGSLAIGEETSPSEETSVRIEPPNDPFLNVDEGEKRKILADAWSRTAATHRLAAPSREQLEKASVVAPDIAVKHAFQWSADPMEIDGYAGTYRAIVQDLLDNPSGEGQRMERSAAMYVNPNKAKPQQSEKVPNQQTNKANNWPSHEELQEMQQHAWKSAALNHGFQAPSFSLLEMAIQITPGEAVTRLFGWTSDDAVIQAVCNTFESALKDISQKYIRKYGLDQGVVLFPGQQPQVAVALEKSTADIVDLLQVSREAWNAVATKKGLSMPNERQVIFAEAVGPEDAIISGFQWAEDPNEVNRIIEDYRAEVQKRLPRNGRSSGAVDSAQMQSAETPESPPPFSVVPGAENWLKSLLDVEMQCALVSHMNREQVDVLLEVSGLSHLFSPENRVTSSNNYGREMDQLLGASLRVERRPDHCVVFDSSPSAADAAHSVEMRTVGMIGPFPRYDLLAADSTASSFDELTAMNIRRYFSERVYDQPMVDMQQTEPTKTTSTRTKYFWDDD